MYVIEVSLIISRNIVIMDNYNRKSYLNYRIVGIRTAFYEFLVVS